MSEKIIIRNFGPITNVEIEIKKTLIFIGPQSSGKSTVAKLLKIFRTIELIVEEDDFESKIGEALAENNISHYFQGDATYLEYTNESYSLYYNSSLWILNKQVKFIEDIRVEQDRINNLIKTIVEDRYKTDSDEQKSKIRKQIYDYNWKGLFLLLKKQIYIPAERILTSIISEAAFSFNEVSLPGALKEFGRHFETARTRSSQLTVPFLNISYKYEEKGKEKGLRVYFDATHSISLAESSSGIQAALPLHLVTETLTSIDSNYSFIVEEPELNLFPTTQKGIVNFLIEKCNDHNQLIITTHSPYVLSVVNNLIFAHKVANGAAGNRNEVEKIIPSKFWISSDSFSAYHFEYGNARPMLNPNTGLISENELDNVSLDIIGERNHLFDIFMNRK
jgi:predicted ATPase